MKQLKLIKPSKFIACKQFQDCIFCLKILYHGVQMFKLLYFLLKTNKKTFQVHICTYTHAQDSVDKLN